MEKKVIIYEKIKRKIISHPSLTRSHEHNTSIIQIYNTLYTHKYTYKYNIYNIIYIKTSFINNDKN